MLDLFTSPFSWFANVVQYSLIFMGVMILLLTIGAIVAIPLGLKLLGVAFAKTIITEGAKAARDLGLDKVAKDSTKEIKAIKDNFSKLRAVP
jgi:hypothetical protein